MSKAPFGCRPYATPRRNLWSVIKSLFMNCNHVYIRWPLNNVINALQLADAPHKDIHSFVGNFTREPPSMSRPQVEALAVENTLWTNTVLASGIAIGFVIYTGKDTRAVMNTNHPETKIGSIDREINKLSKVG